MITATVMKELTWYCTQDLYQFWQYQQDSLSPNIIFFSNRFQIPFAQIWRYHFSIISVVLILIEILFVMCCAIWYLKNVKKYHRRELLVVQLQAKASLPHWSSWRFLNSTNGKESRKASQLHLTNQLEILHWLVCLVF